MRSYDMYSMYVQIYSSKNCPEDETRRFAMQAEKNP
jgi:hypothetical protein